MQQLSKTIHEIKKRPIKILQFGEGNFLRAFADDFIQILNDKGLLDAAVAVVQPVPQGRAADLAVQDGLYTLYLEGIEHGQAVSQHRIIDVLSDFINPYTQYERYLAYAKSEDLQLIISNTTEAGIVLDERDTDFTKCPASFPAKLLAFLRERFLHFDGAPDRAPVIVPCELIDDNGGELRRVLGELAVIKGFDARFINWLTHDCQYCSTLVDRIVPGYPRDAIDRIQAECGYVDNSVVKGEVFHLWVLQSNERLKRLLPLDMAGINAVFADDISPYKQRKVKILNGSHTALVPIAYLSGKDTVREAVEDAVLGTFLNQLIFEEINPTIKLPQGEMTAFAESVLERFANPYIRHELMSIALNSTTKFVTRLLPTLRDFIAIKRTVPKRLLFAFAALITFFKGQRGGQAIKLDDNPEYLERWKAVWANNGSDYDAIARQVCAFSDIWGCDIGTLSGDITALLAKYLQEIAAKGMYAAVGELIG